MMVMSMMRIAQARSVRRRTLIETNQKNVRRLASNISTLDDANQHNDNGDDQKDVDESTDRVGRHHA